MSPLKLRSYGGGELPLERSFNLKLVRGPYKTDRRKQDYPPIDTTDKKLPVSLWQRCNATCIHLQATLPW